jgi:hypothetical protein
MRGDDARLRVVTEEERVFFESHVLEYGTIEVENLSGFCRLVSNL